jgi:hypothetical protein
VEARGRVLTAAVALAGVAAVLLARSSDGITESKPGPPIRELGACPEGAVPDGTPYREVLTRPGAWLRVEFFDTPHTYSERVVAPWGTYLVLGGDRAYVDRLPGVVSEVYMPGTLAKRIGDAVRGHATVTLHTSGQDARVVDFAVATYGQVAAFVGDCAWDELTQPMRADVGVPEMWRYFAAMFGRPSGEVARVLRVPQVDAPVLLADPEAVVLQRAGPEVLATLREVRFAVRAPESWKGRHRLCARMRLGRSECVHLDGASTRGTPRRLWYDPKDPRVELVVVDNLNQRAVAVVAAFDVRRLAAASGVDPDRLLVRVDLAASPSLADVVADPAKGRSAATVRAVP